MQVKAVLLIAYNNKTEPKKINKNEWKVIESFSILLILRTYF